MTEAIRKKLQDEINALEHELVHDLPKEIKKAAALGDLSENAEYHMAKQRQEFVKARVRQLGQRLAQLSMVNMNNIPKDKVGLGSTVKVYDNDKNEEVEFNLVTSEEQEGGGHGDGGHTQRQARDGNFDANNDSRRGSRVESPGIR